MTWFGWVFVAYMAVSALTAISMVGQSRKPLTPETATVVVLTSALLIWGAVTVGTLHG